MQAERLLSLGWKPHTETTRRAMKWAKPAAVKLAGSRPRQLSLYYLCVLLDQLALGSCTAQAAAQVIRMACAAAGATDPMLIARLWVYYLARVRAGDEKTDAGSQVGTIFDVLADGGCAPEWACPYDITKFAEMPPSRAFQMADDSKGQVGVDYAEITGSGDQLIENILNAVAAGHGVAFGSLVNGDYCDGPTGIIHVNRESSWVGGHAQTIIGYDEAQEYVEVLGSWGAFGEPGQMPGVARFGFDYVKAEFSDLWIVNRAPNIIQAQP